MEPKLTIIDNSSDLENLINKIAILDSNDYVSFDTETTGTSLSDTIIGYSVCFNLEESYYVILYSFDKDNSTLKQYDTISNTSRLLHELSKKSLIAHNAIFDCMMVKRNFGIDLMPSIHTDTMILAHILDENRSCGLKELGTILYGDDTRKEQISMKESVLANGGQLTREKYELYKADARLIAYYGAKDALLTLKLFFTLVPDLYEQKLDKFFYEEESMPLLRGPTYDMNYEGIRVDPTKLSTLKKTLEMECIEAKAFIYSEITPLVKDKYPGTNKSNTFNIRSSKQLSWLLFGLLGNEFNTLTKGGKSICQDLGLKVPYSRGAKNSFIETCKSAAGQVYAEGATVNGRKIAAKKIKEPWHYIACGKESLEKLAKKYDWVAAFIKYSKNMKLLSTYIEGIESKMVYNIINPSFLQHGTTSGRYSSKKPNFQNLPRDDKRIKSCLVSRPGKVLIGADYSQLEPRVFASFSGDERLLSCFSSGDDFYSVIGSEVFNKNDCSLRKEDANSFAKKYPALRNAAKVIALSATYGTTAPKMSPALGKSIEESQQIINNYFENFPRVRALMLESHEQAKNNGFVTNLFGRPRRIPRAKEIKRLFGNMSHEGLEYEYRNILNLAINHRIQSTGASIMNRAAIEFWKQCNSRSSSDIKWKEVKIIMQVHDELIIEGPKDIASEVKDLLKYCMENCVNLPGVSLLAEPVIAENVGDLK